MLGPLWVVGTLLLSQTPATAEFGRPEHPRTQAAAAEELNSTVRRLVAQLDAVELRQRDEAEALLIALGPPVLELLPKTSERIPAEVRQRLGRIRQQLRQAQVESTANASLVTLQMDATPVSQVLAALSRQSGNKIVDFRNRFGQESTDPRVSVAWRQVPFWQALDQVLDRTGLTVYSFGEPQAVNVVARSARQLPRAVTGVYTGPLRLEPLGIAATRALNQRGSRSLKLTIEIAWESRLRPIYFKQRLADVQAVDEDGHSLAIDDPSATLEMPVAPGRTAEELVLPLAPPSRDVKQIRRLHGKLIALLPGRTETFRFDHLTTAANVEKRIGSATVILDEVRKNDQSWEVRIRVRFDRPGDSLESHRAWINQNEAYLEGPDGKPIACSSVESTRHAENETGFGYLFDLKEPPSKCTFVYKTPAAIIDTTFDYEFKAIPLP